MFFSQELQSVVQDTTVKLEVPSGDGEQETKDAETLNQSLDKENESKKIKMETETKSEDDDLGPQKPKILFECFYSNLDSSHYLEQINRENEPQIPSNLFMIGGSKLKLDFDDHVSEAERLFKIICPDGQFLPRPPDPEDIIYDSPPEEAQTEEKEKATSQTESKSDQDASKEPNQEMQPSTIEAQQKPEKSD